MFPYSNEDRVPPAATEMLQHQAIPAVSLVFRPRPVPLQPDVDSSSRSYQATPFWLNSTWRLSWTNTVGWPPGAAARYVNKDDTAPFGFQIWIAYDVLSGITRAHDQEKIRATKWRKLQRSVIVFESVGTPLHPLLISPIRAQVHSPLRWSRFQLSALHFNQHRNQSLYSPGEPFRADDDNSRRYCLLTRSNSFWNQLSVSSVVFLCHAGCVILRYYGKYL